MIICKRKADVSMITFIIGAGLAKFEVSKIAVVIKCAWYSDNASGVSCQICARCAFMHIETTIV